MINFLYYNIVTKSKKTTAIDLVYQNKTNLFASIYMNEEVRNRRNLAFIGTNFVYDFINHSQGYKLAGWS